MGSGIKLAGRPKLPTSVSEFLAIVNACPRTERDTWDEPWGTTAPAWLLGTQIGSFWPSAEEVERAFTRMKESSSFAGGAAVFATGAWGGAVKDTYRILAAICDVMKPLAAHPLKQARFRLDERCWRREDLTVGRSWHLEFSPTDDPVAQYFRNLRNALDGLDVRRLGKCEVEVREGNVIVPCGDFFYGRRDKTTCSDEHAQLQRSRRHLLLKRGTARRRPGEVVE